MDEQKVYFTTTGSTMTTGSNVGWNGIVQCSPPQINQQPLINQQPSTIVNATIVNVYLDDGRIFSYNVDSPAKAREHSRAIVVDGYRHTDNSTATMEHYPPHRIVKVKCVGGMTTSYPDKVSGT